MAVPYSCSDYGAKPNKQDGSIPQTVGFVCILPSEHQHTQLFRQDVYLKEKPYPVVMLVIYIYTVHQYIHIRVTLEIIEAVSVFIRQSEKALEFQGNVLPFYICYKLSFPEKQDWTQKSESRKILLLYLNRFSQFLCKLI